MKLFPHYTQHDAMDCGPTCLRLRLCICGILIFLVSQIFTHSMTVGKQTDKVFIPDSIFFVLTEIYGLDQGIRNMSLAQSRKDKNVREYIRKVDSVNFVRACGIVAKYGWIDEKCVRGKYADVESVKSSLYAIFLHNPQEFRNDSIRRLLITEVKKGNLSPQAYLLFLDKYFVVCEKKTVLNSSFKVWLDKPFVKKEDKQLSDSIMKDVGLSTLPDSIFK